MSSTTTSRRRNDSERSSLANGQLADQLQKQRLSSSSQKRSSDDDSIESGESDNNRKKVTPIRSSSKSFNGSRSSTVPRNSSSNSLSSGSADQPRYNNDGGSIARRTNGEKRNRDRYNSEGSESDPDLRRSHASKRPSRSNNGIHVRHRLSDDDDDHNDKYSRNKPRFNSSAAISRGKEGDYETQSTNDSNNVDRYRRSLEEREMEEQESRDVVSTLRKPKKVLPVLGASVDFQASSGTSSRKGWFNSSISSVGGGSEKSYMSGSVLSALSTQELRGSTNAAGPILGTEELERLFPDRKMRVFVGTYNMCEMKLPPASLNDFVLPETSEFVQDLYVIGTQETVANKQEWELKIQETLGPQYVLYHSASHGTLHLAIFLRRDLVWFCSVSEEGSVTTRPGPSSIKTKGAIAICFQFFGTSFLFINCHFTPHDGKSLERIEDYKKIISSLALPKVLPVKALAASVSVDDVTSKFDCVFWMGDLNVRLERNREYLVSTINGLEAGKDPDNDIIDYARLVAHDELTRVIREGLSFKQFQEGRIKFRPSFKYDIGGTENAWDTSDKQRAPSYTDRILFRTRTKNAIACLCYDTVGSIRESDHRPVYGVYEVSLRAGLDTVPLSGGQFNRQLWIEGIRRRSLRTDNSGKDSDSSSSMKPITADSRNKTSSSICAVM